MIARGHILLWIWMFLLTGCREEVQVPADVLPEEQMVPLLIDIHTLEGARNGALILGDTHTVEQFYVKVYEKHGIREADFKKSFAFYSSHPKLFIPVYEQVLDSLKAAGTVYARNGVELDFEQ